MTDKQKELAKKHGTPKQFANAIWKAHDDLFITRIEAIRAIEHYQKEWAEAGGVNAKKRQHIIDMAKVNPALSMAAIARHVGCSEVLVAKVFDERGKWG